MEGTIAIKSLIETRNIYVLKLLCKLSYLSRDKLFSALKICCKDAYGLPNISFISDLHDLIDKQFGGFDQEHDQEIIDWLLAESLIYVVFWKIDVERCCRRLINAGGIVRSRDIARLPKDIFFDYIIDHDMRVNINAIIEAVSDKYDKEVSLWIVERWKTQDDTYTLDDAYRICQNAHGKTYFPQVMQIIRDKDICDAIILCMIWKSWFIDTLNAYIAHSIYADELLLAIRAGLEQHNINTEIYKEMNEMIMRVRCHNVTINDCNEMLAKLTILLPLADISTIYLPKKLILKVCDS